MTIGNMGKWADKCCGCESLGRLAWDGGLEEVLPCTVRFEPSFAPRVVLVVCAMLGGDGGVEGEVRVGCWVYQTNSRHVDVDIGSSLVLDWASVALPSVSSSSATSWLAESMSEASDDHNAENIMLCVFAHHVCGPFSQRNLQEEELFKRGFDVPLLRWLRSSYAHRMNIGGTEDGLGLGDGWRNWRLDGLMLEDAVEEVVEVG